MEFSPHNPIVKLCLQGMAMEDKGQPEAAQALFFQAWTEANTDLEKFLSAHYMARHQHSTADKLKWLETALEFALKTDSYAVNAAFAALHLNIANCYEDLGDTDTAKKHRELAISSQDKPADDGPFYHGTKADLQVGDLLIAGYLSNYESDLTMNHIYFTALTNGAGLAAELAKGDGASRVYIVEPTGGFEDDPNVTNKKFPGNPTRSYRSLEPLKIIGEAKDWPRLTPEQLEQWKERLANNAGKIIN